MLNIRSVCICTCDILDGFMYKCKHLVLSCLPMWLCLVKYTYYSPLRNYLPFTSPNNIVSNFHWNFKIVSRLCYLWILFQVGKGVLLQHNKHKVIGLVPHKFIHSIFHGQSGPAHLQLDPLLRTLKDWNKERCLLAVLSSRESTRARSILRSLGWLATFSCLWL